MRTRIRSATMARPRALMFGGQGAQRVGMATALASDSPAALRVLQEVDEALGFKLSALMQDGPAEQLTQTEHAQPATLAHGAAVLAAAREAAGWGEWRVPAEYVMGHSLGEWTALVACGALPLAGAARLLRLRGRAMQRAAPAGGGAMTALLAAAGAEPDWGAIAARGQDRGTCQVANLNSPRQAVLSGEAEAVARAAAWAVGSGAVERAAPLRVSAPFHCELMAPAAAELAEALREQQFGALSVPLVSGVTGGVVRDPEDVRRLLVQQVTAPVLWSAALRWCVGEGGVREFAELSPAPVLKKFAQQTAALSGVDVRCLYCAKPGSSGWKALLDHHPEE